MTDASSTVPEWLDKWMAARGIALWGIADLEGLPTPADAAGNRLPRAVAWAVPMNPGVMAAIREGPSQAYADEYNRVNRHINALAAELCEEVHSRGHDARPLAASGRTDPDNFRGQFPHKTAATRAGIGWVGRHCQLITEPFGPWVRLGTVFTDAKLPCAEPVVKQFCGRCRACVDACPAGALTGKTWVPGVLREELLDAACCDRWKKEHYFQFNKGHNCGICAAVCPWANPKGG